MTAINQAGCASDLNRDDLKRLIGPDSHRPGPAWARLRVEQIPVWAIIGHVGAVAGTTEPTAISDEVLAQVASDYDIPAESVLAALLYYHEHLAAIDALLNANATAIA